MDSCPLPRVAPYSTRLTGYACTMTQMIKQWRTAWSTSPGTTDPEFPFGIVTLASSGSEGGADIGAMRLAQTAGLGVLPGPAGSGMEHTFLAQAFDLDDRWGPGAGPCQTDASKGGWACCDYSWGLAGKCAYNATTCAGREKQVRKTPSWPRSWGQLLLL